MAKTLIVIGRERERVPFLRGILTRSLQEIGLSFEDSYRVASDIRDELAGVPEVTSPELRARVLERLRPYGEELMQRYERPPHATSTILVRGSHDQVAPFSRGLHRLRLESSGLTGEQAGAAAVAINDLLAEQGISEIASSGLRKVTHDYLVSELGEEAGRRYQSIEEYHGGDRPLLILLGGTVGCGKSTIASQLAHMLEIVRTQSTDMLREVMRVMIPERLMPALHTSSFKSCDVLPAKSRANEDPDERVIAGYLTQAELLSVACEAVIERASKERVSLILEGVHVYPGLLERLPRDSDVIIVPIMLAVLSPGKLRQRIRGRGRHEPDRRAQRYLKNFDRIWALQSYLLSEADRVGATIIHNDDPYRAAQQVVGVILQALTAAQAPPPAKAKQG